MGLSNSPSAPTGRKIIERYNSQGFALGWYPTALSALHDKRPLIAPLHATGAEAPLTNFRPTVVARPQTSKLTDAGGAAGDRFPRCGPGRPCCPRHLFPPVDARGYRLPAPSQSRRRSAHLLRGYPAASVPLPCSARVQPWLGTPSQRRRSMGSL